MKRFRGIMKLIKLLCVMCAEEEGGRGVREVELFESSLDKSLQGKQFIKDPPLFFVNILCCPESVIMDKTLSCVFSLSSITSEALMKYSRVKNVHYGKSTLLSIMNCVSFESFLDIL
jgi:hypothetical protein